MQNIIYDLELSLKSLEGNVDLFVKELKFDTNESLFVTNEDI